MFKYLGLSFTFDYTYSVCFLVVHFYRVSVGDRVVCWDVEQEKKFKKTLSQFPPEEGCQTQPKRWALNKPPFELTRLNTRNSEYHYLSVENHCHVSKIRYQKHLF